VLGSPIAHSLSPVLHRAAYRSLGLADWRYDAFDVPDAECLERFVATCDDYWAGQSLTMPLKRVVQPLLGRLSTVATATGSVNTVLFTDSGLAGDNTDVEGLVQALAEAGCHRVSHAVVIGGGATAASAVAALGRLGCASPQVVVRAPERAAAVVAAGAALDLTAQVHPWDAAPQLLAGADVVVSTVPEPGQRAVATAIRAAGTPSAVLLDVTYQPWPTPAARAWRERGGTAVGGFAMLLHQAVAQVRLMTGQEPDVEAMRDAGFAALAQERPADGR
jgi:shikimate dehydrogenase